MAALTRRGYRLFACAYRELDLPSGKAGESAARLLPRERAEAAGELVFAGLLVLENKLQVDTFGVIKALNEAEIGTVMVTGDHARTAAQVARTCGIVRRDEQLVLGDVDAHGALFDFEQNVRLARARMLALLFLWEGRKLTNAPLSSVQKQKLNAGKLTWTLISDDEDYPTDVSVTVEEALGVPPPAPCTASADTAPEEDSHPSSAAAAAAAEAVALGPPARRVPPPSADTPRSQSLTDSAADVSTAVSTKFDGAGLGGVDPLTSVSPADGGDNPPDEDESRGLLNSEGGGSCVARSDDGAGPSEGTVEDAESRSRALVRRWPSIQV